MATVGVKGLKLYDCSAIHDVTMTSVWMFDVTDAVWVGGAWRDWHVQTSSRHTVTQTTTITQRLLVFQHWCTFCYSLSLALISVCVYHTCAESNTKWIGRPVPEISAFEIFKMANSWRRKVWIHYLRGPLRHCT